MAYTSRKAFGDNRLRNRLVDYVKGWYSAAHAAGMVAVGYEDKGVEGKEGEQSCWGLSGSIMMNWFCVQEFWAVKAPNM